MLPLLRPFSSTRKALKIFLQLEIPRACQSWGWSICVNQWPNANNFGFQLPSSPWLPPSALPLSPLFHFHVWSWAITVGAQQRGEFNKSNSSRIAMRGIFLILLWRLLPLYIQCTSNQHGRGIFSRPTDFLESKQLPTVYFHYQLYPMDLRSALYSMTTCLVPLEFFIVAKVID